MSPAQAAHLAQMNAIRLAKYDGRPVFIADEAFWAKTEPEPNSGCLLWVGASDQGYGRVWSRRGNRKCKPAHQVAYESAHGPVPLGLEIDHLCRVRSCVNPRHLEAVPLIVNNHRGMGAAARNLRKTHCPRGHLYDAIWRNGKVRTCNRCRREKWAERKNAAGPILSA